MKTAALRSFSARLFVILPLLSALAGLVITWAAIIWQLRIDERHAMAEGSAAATRAAASHAASLDDMIDHSDQLLVAVRHMRQNGGTAEQIEGLIDDLPAHSWMNPVYIDANGVIRSSRLVASRGTNVAAQSYFLNHRQSPDDSLVIHAPAPGLGAMSGKTVIRLTRRINLPDGRFGGVASLAIPVQALTDLRGAFAAHATDLVVIASREGPVLANSASAGIVTEAVAKNPVAALLAQEKSFDGARALLEKDGHYLGATARLLHHPLDVLVALDKRALLAELSARTWQLTTLGAVISLVLAAFAGWGTWRRFARAEEEERARRVRAVFRQAVDDSKEEFYMLTPLRSPTGALSDFRIEDCNTQAARSYLMARDAMLGKSLSTLLRPANWQVTRDFLAKAMVDGFAETESCFYRDGAAQKRWVQSRATLVADGLAVTLRDVTESKDNERRLRELALTDGLTGLPNRHWVNQELASVLKRAAQAQEYVAALFIDLDNFKAINDTLGHQVGDQYLRAASEALRQVVRKHDIVVRLGGDEFLVLVLHLDDVQLAHRVAADIVRRIREVGEQGLWSSANPRASVGIATFPMDARTSDDLVQAADIAMYEAKRLGKDRYEMYVPTLRERLRDEFGLESALRRAVAEGALGLKFQPRASALTDQLLGFEALARWEHPVLGQVPPARFIPIAEKHNLIDDIGCWVVEEVCRTLVRWRSSDKLLHPVSVNISAKQLKTPRLRNHLQECTRRYQISPAQIELELTESTMVGSEPAVRKELKLLSEMGHKLMIDDFGTGYSSLAQLQHLKVDVLKIDASFVRSLSSGDEGGLICKAMVQIGKTLGIDVVAEGVETRQQLEQLQRFGCDEVQGYLLAEPMPADEAMALLDHRTLFSVDTLEQAPTGLPSSAQATDAPPQTRNPHPGPAPDISRRTT